VLRAQMGCTRKSVVAPGGEISDGEDETRGHGEVPFWVSSAIEEWKPRSPPPPESIVFMVQAATPTPGWLSKRSGIAHRTRRDFGKDVIDTVDLRPGMGLDRTPRGTFGDSREHPSGLVGVPLIYMRQKSGRSDIRRRDDRALSEAPAITIPEDSDLDGLFGRLMLS